MCFGKKRDFSPTTSEQQSRGQWRRKKQPEQQSSAVRFPSFSSLVLLPESFLSTHFPLWLINYGKCYSTVSTDKNIKTLCHQLQRTSLTTAWGIQTNPVNVFILKKSCTFNRKSCFFFCLHFFAKGKTISSQEKRGKKMFPQVCACRLYVSLTVESLTAYP